MLSGSVCQMGQEAGLAGVAAAGLESHGDIPPPTPGSAALGTAGGAGDLWLTLFSSSSQSGHSFEGRLLSLLNPSAVYTNASFPFVREPGGSCLKACTSVPPPAWLPTVPTFHPGDFQVCFGYLKTG